MTPGIQPSKVKIRLRKKLAIRPVNSTASGGSATQKKYRSAFIANSFSSLGWRFGVRRVLAICRSWTSYFDPRPPTVASGNPQSQDSRADPDKADAAAIQARRFV